MTQPNSKLFENEFSDTVQKLKTCAQLREASQIILDDIDFIEEITKHLTPSNLSFFDFNTVKHKLENISKIAIGYNEIEENSIYIDISHKIKIIRAKLIDTIWYKIKQLNESFDEVDSEQLKKESFAQFFQYLGAPKLKQEHLQIMIDRINANLKKKNTSSNAKHAEAYFRELQSLIRKLRTATANKDSEKETLIEFISSIEDLYAQKSKLTKYLPRISTYNEPVATSIKSKLEDKKISISVGCRKILELIKGLSNECKAQEVLDHMEISLKLQDCMAFKVSEIEKAVQTIERKVKTIKEDQNAKANAKIINNLQILTNFLSSIQSDRKFEIIADFNFICFEFFVLLFGANLNITTTSTSDLAQIVKTYYNSVEILYSDQYRQFFMEFLGNDSQKNESFKRIEQTIMNFEIEKFQKIFDPLTLFLLEKQKLFVQNLRNRGSDNHDPFLSIFAQKEVIKPVCKILTNHEQKLRKICMTGDNEFTEFAKTLGQFDVSTSQNHYQNNLIDTFFIHLILEKDDWAVTFNKAVYDFCKSSKNQTTASISKMIKKSYYRSNFRQH